MLSGLKAFVKPCSKWPLSDDQRTRSNVSRTGWMTTGSASREPPWYCHDIVFCEDAYYSMCAYGTHVYCTEENPKWKQFYFVHTRPCDTTECKFKINTRISYCWRHTTDHWRQWNRQSSVHVTYKVRSFCVNIGKFASNKRNTELWQRLGERLASDHEYCVQGDSTLIVSTVVHSIALELS